MKTLNSDIPNVKIALVARAEEVCRLLLPGGKRVGQEWHAGDVGGSSGGSLSVCLAGDKAGLWKDFAGAPDDKGDLLTLWQRCRRVDFKTALHDAARWANVQIKGNGADGKVIAQKDTARLKPAGSIETKADMSKEWARCVDALDDVALEKLAKWRGYSAEFVRWIKAQGLMGLHEGMISFAVHESGKVIGWHYRIKADGSWRYFPAGIGTHPLVVGDLSSGMPVWAFESPWDALAALDACSWEEDKRVFAVVATRGASNAAKLVDVIEENSTVILWPQNDDPGSSWAKDAARMLPSCKVKIATVPSPHKDTAAWHKDGAGNAEFVKAHRAAQLVHEIIPVEATLPNPGVFPIEALPAVMRAVVKTVAETFELPLELPGMAALATWAGAIGKGTIVRGAVNGRDTHCNLFIFIGAPKSFGKGSAASLVQPFLKLSQQLGENFREFELPSILARLKVAEKQSGLLVAQIATGKDGKRLLTQSEKSEVQDCLIKMEQEVAELKRLAEALPSYHAGSATGAALAMVLRRNNGMVFSYSPEAGDMVRVALGRYTADGKADADLLLSGYTVEPFKENRIGRGEVDITPCITTLWLCQPSLMREIIGNDEAFERGLTARALMLCCEREGPIPHDDGTERHLNPAAMDAWQAALGEVVKLRQATEPHVIDCSPEARKIFRSFHNEAVDYRNGSFHDIEAELGRWRENAIRIAGGLAVAERMTTITGEIAQRAVALARWAHLSALALIYAGAETRRRARLERVVSLAREASGSITLRQLRDSHGIQEAEVEDLVRIYPSHLIVEDRKAGAKGGRPSRIVKLVAT